MTRATMKSVPSGKVPLSLKIEQALEALVLLGLLLEFDDLALEHLHLLREALGVSCGPTRGS